MEAMGSDDLSRRRKERHTMTKWPYHPNLRKKPHAPSKGRGPVQRAIRRVFMASGAEVLNSTDIYDWAHGRRRFGRRKSMPFGVYSRTLRTLRAMCEPVGRSEEHTSELQSHSDLVCR